jgi:hypothetical protein
MIFFKFYVNYGLCDKEGCEVWTVGERLTPEINAEIISTNLNLSPCDWTLPTGSPWHMS